MCYYAIMGPKEGQRRIKGPGPQVLIWSHNRSNVVKSGDTSILFGKNREIFSITEKAYLTDNRASLQNCFATENKKVK